MQNRIQELRKSHKMTQAELADVLEVTRQTIISLEKGKYNASLFLAHDIAEFFGLSIEEVFIFEGGHINVEETIRETKARHE
ncbi:helix-turn-helix transcriptional regulator [Leuconostoc miyukkimchii]|uniref:helix-turn-helix transcriptional regulator n=1 Tax=Leuconostoc miyukkimchii TaxID=910540 RepID=UPI001C7DE77C|nr:helix-turn-helix transcriptional regulator [Leuconostoc miyukkimchii]